MNLLRRVFSGKKEAVPKEENGEGGEQSDEDEDKNSDESSSENLEIEDIASLANLNDDVLQELCKDNGYPTNGGRFELIGRLLDFIKDNLSVNDLLTLESSQLAEVCKGRGISISNGSTNEEIAQLILNSVLSSDKEKTPKKGDKLKSSTSPNKTPDINKSTRKTESRRSSGLLSSFLGKRSRAESEYTSIKKRRLSISSNEFMKKAEPIKLRIDGTYYDIKPNYFKGTGAFGWYHTDRQELTVNGENLNVAWNLNMTVIDTK